MIFTPTKLDGSFIVDLEFYRDERGFFARTWDAAEFADVGLTDRLTQCGISHNMSVGTLRGMHYQREPHAQEKVVRCIAGAIYDVIVDVRPQSPTHREWIGAELTADNGRMLFIPHGFAHGFVTLMPETRVEYYFGSGQVPSAEAGVRYDDPAFGIHWPVPASVLSDRDRHWPDYIP